MMTTKSDNSEDQDDNFEKESFNWFAMPEYTIKLDQYLYVR